VEVVNDELFVTDEDGDFFEYKPKLPESQRVQEMLFHEKQTIIENCLFGVDINPNSVKICRLRLWIELLKNAYYKAEDELETLPNIDINIKCGNSLISRFALDSDLKKALKKGKWSIEGYRVAVMGYRNAETKEQKRAMEKLIDEIKGGFQADIYTGGTDRLSKARIALAKHAKQTQLFALSKEEKTEWNTKAAKLAKDVEKAEQKIEAIAGNKIYENAFEWRFEFPEVLDNDGSFVGFDAVIGNPPYIRQEEFSEIKPYLKQSYRTFTGTADLYVYFIELGLRNLRPGGTFSFITPNKWMRATYGQPLRNFIKENRINSILDFGDLPVFEEATTYPCILSIDKSTPQPAFNAANITTLNYPVGLAAYVEETQMEVFAENLREEGWLLENPRGFALMQKLRVGGKPLREFVGSRVSRGLTTGLNEAFVVDRITRDRLVSEHKSSTEILKPYLRGKDVKRWGAESADLYIIKIESSENAVHPWSGKPEKEAERIFAKTFPAIHAHLENLRKELINRADQGKYFWEQRSCRYWNDFDTSKIVSTKISIRPTFALDSEGCYLGNTCYFFPAATSASYVLGLLNSKLFFTYAKKVFVEKQGGWFEVQPENLELFPIPTATPAQQTEIEKRVENILALKKANPDADISALETEIDRLVYKLYDLTEDEIAIVESSGR
jgi:hypothetical protein